MQDDGILDNPSYKKSHLEHNIDGLECKNSKKNLNYEPKPKNKKS